MANAVQNSPVTAEECESDIKRFRVLLLSSHDYPYPALAMFLAFNQLAPDLTVSNKRSDVVASIMDIPLNASLERWEDTLHYKNVGMSP